MSDEIDQEIKQHNAQVERGNAEYGVIRAAQGLRATAGSIDPFSLAAGDVEMVRQLWNSTQLVIAALMRLEELET